MSEQTTLIEKAGQVLAKYQQSLASPKIDGAVVIASALLAVAGEIERQTALLEENTALYHKQVEIFTALQELQMANLNAQLDAAEQRQDGAA